MLDFYNHNDAIVMLGTATFLETNKIPVKKQKPDISIGPLTTGYRGLLTLITQLIKTFAASLNNTEMSKEYNLSELSSISCVN